MQFSGMTIFPLGGAGGGGEAADRKVLSYNAAQLPRFQVLDFVLF